MKYLVPVLERHDTDGQIKPVMIYCDNGKTLQIDKIIDIRPAASLKSGGLDMRYICRVKGWVYCFYDEGGVWFVEKVRLLNV